MTWLRPEVNPLKTMSPFILMPRMLPSKTVSGHTVFDGSIRGIKINGDIVFNGFTSGRSHVIGGGWLGYDKGIFASRNLRMRMLPLQMDLVKVVMGPMPIGGTLTGNATFNGSTAALMVAQGDVTHVEGGAVSRATGRAGFRTHGVKYY